MDKILESAAEYTAGPTSRSNSIALVEARGTAPTTAMVKHTDNDGQKEQLALLGGGMRRMVDLINRLRASGIEDLGLPLPKIAVIGNQSAGKSSLIEAISGIKVPRSSGTCTRCPLEIVLRKTVTPDEPWSCRVSLRLKCKYVRSRTSPWEPQQSHQVHFTTFQDKALVEEVLLRAQTAILNPSRDWREYTPSYTPPYSDGTSRLDFTKPMKKSDLEVMFSPNVVCMDIIGPDLPDLSFIDLPGVIHNTEKHEEYLVPLVRKLVEGYVKEQDCLVLLTMTMRDDPENQSASSIAQRWAADRTIGALTKPDLIEPGEHRQWIEILRGNAHRLQHGYFVTKQPNQRALENGVDGAQGRILEEEFFRTTEPWCTEVQDMQLRFGTPALAEYLSHELGELIKKRLPMIQSKINNEIDLVQMALMTLPAPPPENHVRLAEGILNEYDRRIRRAIDAQAQNAIRDKSKNFSKAISMLSPRLMLLEDGEAELKIEKSLKFGLRDAWFDGTRSEPESPSRTKYIANGTAMEGVVTPLSNRKRNLDGTEAASSKRAKLGVPAANEPIKYTLPQLAHIIDHASPARIPGQISTEAIDQIIRSTLETWARPLDTLIGEVIHIIMNIFQAEFMDCFGRYEKTEFNRVCQDQTRALLLQVIDEQRALINGLLDQEMEYISTIDEDGYKTAKSKHMAVLANRRERNLQEQKDMRIEKERQMIAVQRENGGVNGVPVTPKKSGGGRGRHAPPPVQDLDESDVPDKYTREIETLAMAKAYHDVARKRFADNVNTSLMSKILKSCKESVVNDLRESLELDQPHAEEQCRRLLAEDPDQERQRQNLNKKLDLLKNGLRELES